MSTEINLAHVHFRSGRPEDGPRLQELFNNEGWWYGQTDVPYFLQYTPDWVLIAQYENKVIGCVALNILSDTLAHIGLYVVDKPYRGRGIGKTMWRMIVEKAGCNMHLCLSAFKDKFEMYAKMGFKPDPISALMVTDARLKDSIPFDNDHCSVKPLTINLLPSVVKYDTMVTSLNRDVLLRQWSQFDGVHFYVATLANDVTKDDVIVGYAAVSSMRKSWKRLGPLFANDDKTARNLFSVISRQYGKDNTFIFGWYGEKSSFFEQIFNWGEVEHYQYSYLNTGPSLQCDYDKMFVHTHDGMART